MADEVIPIRDANGHFLPGHGGLPGAGRPKGMSNADKIRLFLEPERERLLGRTLEFALGVNAAGEAVVVEGTVAVRALEIALTRLGPPPKADSERVSIAGFRDATTLQAKAEAVLAAAADGTCSVEAAEKLLRVIDMYSKAIVATDHERRIAAIEAGRTPAIEHTAAEPWEQFI